MNDSTQLTETDEGRAYGVLLARKDAVDTALAQLAKRAARKGIPGALAWTWGKAYTETRRVRVPCEAGGTDRTITIERVPLTIVGECPRLRGWRFLATLQHLDGENIVRVLPGVELPASYRTRPEHCDHCNARRRRTDTYVLAHDDGRTVQVGSTCLRDFLGGDDAAKIAARAELLAMAAAVVDEDEECLGGGSCGSRERVLDAVLPVVAWCVRTVGWTSRTVARERDGVTATADLAWSILVMPRVAKEVGYTFDAVDRDHALAAAAWAEALTDAEVDAARGDYLHNLRAACRTGLVSSRTMGIVASVITAYERHLGRERERAQRAERPRLDAYVGTVGDKVSFGLPPKVGKKGQPLKGAPVVLSAEPLVLDFVSGYETDYGYTTILKFRTIEGAIVLWKASGNVAIERRDVGKRYTVEGRIKAHAPFKGDKQTLLTRCDVREVTEVATAAE